MKLKIMIIALLFLAGIGSAVNRLPATEFVGDVDMGGNNIYDANYVNSTYISISSPQLNAIIFWNGSHAIGLYENGTMISSGTDNDTVIQATHDAIYATGGGVIHFKDYFMGIDTTIEQYASVAFIGEGDNDNDLTGFEGTANPLLHITRSSARATSTPLEKMRIRTTGASNDGVRSETATYMTFRECQFRTDGSNAALVNVTWWSNSLICDCSFYQEDEDQSGCALKIWGEGSTYCAINSVMSSCTITHFQYGVYIYTDSKDYIAGTYITENTIGWCNYAVYINGTGSADISDNMLDGQLESNIYLDNANCVNIHDNYMYINATWNQNIRYNMVAGGGYMLQIHDNIIGNYQTSSLWAIEITTLNASLSLVDTIIAENTIAGFAGGVKIQHATAENVGQTITGNIIRDASYACIMLDGTKHTVVTGNTIYDSADISYSDNTDLKVASNVGITDYSA